MGFWKNRKKHQHFGKRGDLETQGSIRTYAPHTALTPVDYKLSPIMADLEADFPKLVAQFLKEGKPDRYNGSFMDAVIQRTTEEALHHLALQRADHVGSIVDMISKIWSGDKIKAKAKLEQTEEALIQTDREIARLERICYKGTSFEETQNNEGGLQYD